MLYLASYHLPHHHAAAGAAPILKMIISATIHGLIYGVIFKLFRHMSTIEAIVVAVIAVGLILGFAALRGGRRRS